MPRSSAATHELQRVGLLAGLPGQTLLQLAKRVERLEVPPGTSVVREGDQDDTFYLVFAGMLAVANSIGPRRLLRPGDYFGEVAPALDTARTATVTSMTPCVLGAVDRETFDEFIRPLFADD
jgi:CRP-like cAMP-binding protein